MVNTLTWHEAFSVGHPGLDDEHRTLVETIGAICLESQAAHGTPANRTSLSNLKAIVARHFEHENLVLRTIIAGKTTETYSPAFLKIMSEDVLNMHITDHQRTLDDLDSLISPDSLCQTTAEQGLCGELKKWFVLHAVKHDVHLKTLFQAMQSECPQLLRRLT